MSEHLLQQTLPPEMAAMAEYYEQGVTPPTPANAAASRYGHLAVAGRLPLGGVLDELVKIEILRLAESALTSDGASIADGELKLQAIGAFEAAGLISREESRASLERFGIAAVPHRLEAAVSEAGHDRDYSSATASPRRDMNPALAKRLGIDVRRGLTQSQVAFSLNGQRTDGEEIKGRTKRATTLSVGSIFQLDHRRKPTRIQMERVLAGSTVDGVALPPDEASIAMPRLLAALGVRSGAPSELEIENILSGKMADGRDLSNAQFQAAVDTSKARIGYIDFTFSAPKSVSIAWAFAPTKAERAIIHQAHSDAIDSVMRAVEFEIGRARKGHDGRDGYDPGAIGWVSFDHYTARPTVEIVRTGADGQPATELHRLIGTAGRVPGDMQVHTHVAVFNAVETAAGRLGGLDLAQLEGRVHEWGALYQAFLAGNLRRHGVEADLDARTEMARLIAVPESVVTQFSKRTLGGTAAAREYARSQGLDWDGLDADRKIGLLKAGVQNPRGAKSDDVSDLATWRGVAEKLGYRHRSVLRPYEIVPVFSRAERLEAAYVAALPLLSKQFRRRAVIDGTDARIAAAKGLIASGVESPDDVSAITRAFRERGIKQGADDTALVWGSVVSKQGRERVALTTTLHEREEGILIVNARSAAGDKGMALKPEQVEAAIAAFPEIDFKSVHGQAQRAIIDQLGCQGRLSLAIGVAGSGKSTLLKPLVKAWQADGRTVHGIALAWRQSDDLAEAGIETRKTRAVESFLRAVQSGRLQLDQKSVLVVDEIGLLGTRQLNDILAVQKDHGFQLVMIGDPKQMQAVEAGPVIDLLRRALGDDAVPELGTSVRQKGVDERETTLMLRNGQTAEALSRKEADGTLRVVPGGYVEAVAYIGELWQQRRDANADRADFRISVSAPTNHDAHEISVAIRERRRVLGEIGLDRATIKAADVSGRTYDLALAEGDRVRLFKRVNATFAATKTEGNIGRNGTVLEIAGFVDHGLMLRTPTGKVGLVAWTTLRDRDSGRVQLDYGDALTTNTAQGSTVTEHIHAMPAGSHLVSAFGAYTSGSRHRDKNFIVTSDGAERAEVIGRRPLGDRREVNRSDVLDNLVRNFARQPEKESALNLIDRAAGLRRGTVRTVQGSLLPLEARAAEGLVASSLPDRLAQRRITRLLEERLPGLTARFRRHGKTLAEIVHAGASAAERLAAIARHRAHKFPDATAYWRKMAQSASPKPEQTEAEKLSRRRERRR
jgi:molybdopterin-guanine dinucleotide biosynthesis protein